MNIPLTTLRCLPRSRCRDPVRPQDRHRLRRKAFHLLRNGGPRRMPRVRPHTQRYPAAGDRVAYPQLQHCTNCSKATTARRRPTRHRHASQRPAHRRSNLPPSSVTPELKNSSSSKQNSRPLPTIFAQPVIPGLRTIDLDTEYEAFLSSGRPHPSRHLRSYDENAIAELFYTSGSTGIPKGVMLSHRTISICTP